jgi:hypothetical protein
MFGRFALMYEWADLFFPIWKGVNIKYQICNPLVLKGKTEPIFNRNFSITRWRKHWRHGSFFSMRINHVNLTTYLFISLSLFLSLSLSFSWLFLCLLFISLYLSVCLSVSLSPGYFSASSFFLSLTLYLSLSLPFSLSPSSSLTHTFVSVVVGFLWVTILFSEKKWQHLVTKINANICCRCLTYGSRKNAEINRFFSVWIKLWFN